MRLQGKVVLVTSAQNPCGNAIVTGFAREGADFTIADLEADKAQLLAGEIQALGRRALPCQFDVTKKSEVEKVVEEALAHFGRIDVLLNCSSVTHEQDFFQLSGDDFDDCLARGPKAYFLTCQLVGQKMAERKSGKIINLATTDARLGSGGTTGSSVAHSSIESMTRAIAQALGYYGVNVNALIHGPMESTRHDRFETLERRRRIPFGRLAEPEDIVGAAIFLASGDANFVVGESLYVDGGFSNAAVTEDSFRPA